MRLFVLTLAASAFAYPAFASDHSHHRHSAAVRSHQHGVRVAARHRLVWRQRVDAEPDRYSAVSSFDRPYARPVVAREAGHGELDAMIARHAQMNGVPASLVHRVVVRESRYNPRAVGRGGALGLMQIKYATARAMGYTGSPSGLLDPETNLTYAVRYLAGAYRVAGGSQGAAVSNYARGYYGAAKRVGVSPYAEARSSERWGGSFAAAQPVEQVAWAAPVRRTYARHWRRREATLR